MAKNDIVIIADVHVGLHYEDHAARAQAARNTVELLKTIDPGVIILNGDFADLWVYYTYEDHRQDAIEQARPYAEYLKTSRARTIFIPGNCDDLRSSADIDRLYDILEDPTHSIPFEFVRAFWDPQHRLLVTHGHALPKLTRDLIARKDMSNPFAVDLPASSDHGTSSMRIVMNRLASIASHVTKRIGPLQRLIQLLIIRRLRALVQELRIAGLIAQPTWIIFSHTHLPGAYGNILNTGTAGPQGSAEEATIVHIDATGEPHILRTYHPTQGSRRN